MPERAYVVGDLHLGAGANDPLEDFRDDDVFARLCERIGNPETTLILNGDIIDFAQIAPFEVPKAAHLLWPESASLQKARVAIAAHPQVFAGMRGLLARGGRVVYLNGNHDLDVIWASVQQCIAHALGDPPASQLGFVIGHHVYHGVHVEHGHAWTPENCPRDPLSFRLPGPGDEPYLERTWGTDFMLRFYNELERSYPFADNVKPMLALLWHGLRNDWVGGRELARLFYFLRARGLPWSGVISATLSSQQPLAPANVVAAFEDADWRQVLRERMHADGDFITEFNAGLEELEPGERGIATGSRKLAPEVPVAPDTDHASETLGLFREDRQLRAARERLSHPGITHVVFGHTHELIDGALEGCLYNYGTWLPALDLRAPHVQTKIAAQGITLEMLGDEKLYATDRRLVRIDGEPNCAAKVRLVTDTEP